MSVNRNERDTRDYIPLENTVSTESSSSEEVEFPENLPLLMTGSNDAGENGNFDLIASGDGIEVTGAEIHEPPPRIVLAVSSGYLASVESSSGSGVDCSDDLPVSNNLTSSSSSDTESTVFTESYTELHSYMMALLDGEDSAGITVRDVTEELLEQHTYRTPLATRLKIFSKKSRSADSFFSKIDKTITFDDDNADLYRMTINVKGPSKYISISGTSSLESNVRGKNKISDILVPIMAKEDFPGDSHIVSVQQIERELELEPSENKKDDGENSDSRSSRWNMLRNLNALYPVGGHSPNYQVFVNTGKEDKDMPSKSRDFDTDVDYSAIPRSAITADEERNIHISDILSFVNHSAKSLGNMPIVSQFDENYHLGAGFPYHGALVDADRDLIEKPAETYGRTPNTHADGKMKDISGKVPLKLHCSSKSNLKDPKEVDELYYIGDTKSDTNNSDRCLSSETCYSASSKESSGCKWSAEIPDDNNNYMLSQRSSDDSMDYEGDRKFQFTKDISGKEEYLRQNLSLSEEQLNYQNESRRRVTFNNDFPAYVPARQQYLRTRKLDFSPKSTKSTLTMDASSCTDFLDESQEALRKFGSDFAMQQKIIDEAEKISYRLLRDLQCLWMNVSDMGCLPSIEPQTILGDHNLIQQIQLCSFITDQMNQNQDWRTSSTEPIGTEKLQELQKANKLLQKELDSCKIIQNCLESEINYAAKEKALLNDEVKHLSYQLATRTCKIERPLQNSPKMSPRSRNPESSKVTICTQTIFEGESVSREIDVPKPNFVKKREDDFNTIMDCVRDRKGVMDTLNLQIDKYQDDVQALKKQIESTNDDKEKLYMTFESLLEEKQVLVRERNHYESLLKLILNEKTNHESNLQDLLERVMTKLSTFTSENEGKTSRFSLLEGALQAVQEQNISYREEIIQLKEKVTHDTENHTLMKSELESAFQKVSEKVEDLKKTIEDKNELQRSQEEKLSQLHELQTIATQAKNFLDKSLAEKDFEIARLREAFEDIYKVNTKHQRKVHELQKLNAKLTREIHEHKINIEQLGSIINQLRQSLGDQKAQYCDRVKCIGHEACQSKEHCRWLQSQIDYLNNQLADSHERVKAHEQDKTSLAQQVLSAEEERKVVDRKLNELKSALESDTMLRQALMERNEALQVEINRLRRAKMSNIHTPTLASIPSLDGEFGNPPSELSSINEGFSSMNSYPLSDYKPLTTGERRKNRYSAQHRKGNDAPRTVVSLHNAAGAAGYGHNASEINGAGAACSPPTDSLGF